MECDRCHRIMISWATIYTTVRGSHICETCISLLYWRCDDCGGWNRDGAECGNNCGDDSSDDDDDDDDNCWCGSCSSRDDSSLIKGYYYKPEPVFFGNGPLYLGAEIEVETYERSRNARIATEHLGDLGYLKDDSSISGFEIVTHPMSYDYAMSDFPWPMLSALADGGCEATPSTGLHVHVSRAGFTSEVHRYRWLKFIYRNQPDVIKVARRYSESWAPFTVSGRRDAKWHAKGTGDYNTSRYQAVNVTNESTFELRIFASSLEPVQVQAALGLAAASVEYTRNLTPYAIAHNGGWEWPTFRTWVDNHPEYAPLKSEMETTACAF